MPEGRLVNQGDPLFLIDPREFVAAVNVAKARLREAEAASLLAKAEYTRAEKLFAQRSSREHFLIPPPPQ